MKKPDHIPPEPLIYQPMVGDWVKGFMAGTITTMVFCLLIWGVVWIVRNCA